MSLDDNELLQAGKLGATPADGTKVVPSDAPRVLTVRDLLRGARENAEKKRAATAVTTGNFRLDDITGGLIPGFVWVFGADTNWGKSSWLLMVADENMRTGRRVLIVSAEDDQKLYGDRLMLRRSRISADDLRRKRITDEDRRKMLEVERKAEDAPVYLDARGRGVEWVARHVKNIIREQNIDLVAYDYLGAFDNEKTQPDRRNQLTYIARTLTDITKTLDKTGIIFSQITIEKGKPIPDKHSIRDSRDVSNAAEVVILGFCPEKPITAASRDPGKPPVQIADVGDRCIFIDKCKNGPRGAILRLPWDTHSACFDTVLDPEAERLAKFIDASGGADFQTDNDDWRNQ